MDFINYIKQRLGERERKAHKESWAQSFCEGKKNTFSKHISLSFLHKQTARESSELDPDESGGSRSQARLWCPYL